MQTRQLKLASNSSSSCHLSRNSTTTLPEQILVVRSAHLALQCARVAKLFANTVKKAAHFPLPKLTLYENLGKGHPLSNTTLFRMGA
jgi:hypothetical protein